MMRIVKRKIWDIYRKSPLLFRIDAFFSRITQCAVEKGDGVCCGDIQSLGEYLRFLDSADAKIYGREIIEGYVENAEKTILLVSNELSLSGAPIVLLRLAEALKKRGYQTIIICGLDGEIFSENVTMMGIPVIYYPDLLKTDIIFRIRKLFSKIIVNTIKCVHVINQLNGTDSSVMWWIHEASCCYDRGSAKKMPHRVEDNIHLYSGGLYAREMLVSRFPEYKRVKNLMFYVQDLAKSLNSSTFHLDLPDKKIFALFGAVQYRKGQDVLLNAIGRLPERVRNECYFLFVGYNSDPKITNMLINNTYSESLLYMDEIQYSDFCRLYEDIDFLICSSRDDPGPAVVAEAMSLSKPCICSEHTGVAGIVQKYNSGYVYRHNSASELARRIEEAFYLSEDEYRKLSKKARSAFEYVFSEKAFSKNLDRCLEQI